MWVQRYLLAEMAQQHRILYALFAAILILTPLVASGQSQVKRGTISSGVGSTASNSSMIHGTVSQSVAGRTSNIGQLEANALFGFWHKAKAPNADIIVSIPKIEAHVGTELMIPIKISEVTGLISGVRRDFTARIRYNASILEPTSPNVSCLRVGDTCYLDISGSVLIETGNIAEIQFRATLGNDTATPLEILNISFATVGEETIRTRKEDGFFTLLGVCRAGDGVRLIHAAPTSARIVVRPNPVRNVAQISFSSIETGKTRLSLVDAVGNTVATIAEFDAVAERLYNISSSLVGISSGSYTLVCHTPSQMITTRLLVIE